MLNTLLADGQSSRLYKSLVDEKQIAMDAGSFPFPYEEPGVNITYALPNMGNSIEYIEKEMIKEIDKVKSHLIDEEEFQKLKNKVENDIVRSNTKIETRANNLARYYTYFGNTNLINTELDNYMSVTRKDIQRVAQKYFTADNCVVLFYLPKNQQ
jgi:predicted Zn-dependent peptidase